MKSIIGTAMFCVLALSGCEPKMPSGVKEGDPDYPQLNPNPKQVVRVFGKVPSDFNLSFGLLYEATAPDKHCWQSFGYPKRAGEQVKFKRNGDRFELAVTVDKYLPGECRWRFNGLDANLAQKDRPEDRQNVSLINGSEYDWNDSTPRCPSYNEYCNEERYRRLSNPNDKIPVEARCTTTSISDDANRDSRFKCRDSANDSYKKTHLLKPYTRQVEFNVSYWQWPSGNGKAGS